MNTKTNFRMLFTALALVFTTIAFAQKTKNFITSPQYINGYSVILVFDATFEGFATQLKINNTKLYVLNGPDNFESSAKAKGLKKVSIPGAYNSGYPIDRFTVYLKGTAILSEGAYSKYFWADFKVQLSDALGDFTTPEFSQEAKDYYANKKDVWEKHGDLKNNDLTITEIYFKDFDIRIK